MEFYFRSCKCCEGKLQCAGFFIPNIWGLWWLGQQNGFKSARLFSFLTEVRSQISLNSFSQRFLLMSFLTFSKPWIWILVSDQETMKNFLETSRFLGNLEEILRNIYDQVKSKKTKIYEDDFLTAEECVAWILKVCV